MSLLEDVRALVPTITARAAQAEAERCVPPDLIAELALTGCFRLYVPATLGGPEVDPFTALEVMEALAAADGSTGWTSFILNTTLFASYLEPAVAKEILDSVPNSGMAGQFGPMGTATPDGDAAFRLSGRWPFNSGSPHASWFCQGAFVFDDDRGPRMLGPGTPDWRFMFVPADQVEILDTWRVSGLRGTASHDVTVTDVVVPVERMTNPLFHKAPQDAPHFRFSFFALLSTLMTGFPLGVARRALDEFVALSTTKSRGGASVLADTETVAIAVLRAEGQLRAARAFAVDAIGAAWDQARAGDDVGREQRLAIRMATFNAMRAGRDAVDVAFDLAGGSALFDDSPLQRCWRDIHAASHHIFFSSDHALKVSRALLGRPTDEWLF